jgi:hypothetical protein
MLRVNHVLAVPARFDAQHILTTRQSVRQYVAHSAECAIKCHDECDDDYHAYTASETLTSTLRDSLAGSSPLLLVPINLDLHNAPGSAQVSIWEHQVALLLYHAVRNHPIGLFHCALLLRQNFVASELPACLGGQKVRACITSRPTLITVQHPDPTCHIQSTARCTSLPPSLSTVALHKLLESADRYFASESHRLAFRRWLEGSQVRGQRDRPSADERQYAAFLKCWERQRYEELAEQHELWTYSLEASRRLHDEWKSGMYDHHLPDKLRDLHKR